GARGGGRGRVRLPRRHADRGAGTPRGRVRRAPALHGGRGPRAPHAPHRLEERARGRAPAPPDRRGARADVEGKPGGGRSARPAFPGPAAPVARPPPRPPRPTARRAPAPAPP